MKKRLGLLRLEIFCLSTSTFSPPSKMSTRIIITNLPPSTNLTSFRAHLTTSSAASASSSKSNASSRSEAITDVKVYPKRRFAFVGYRTSEDALSAQSWWNGTWFAGGRLKVEVVDEDKPLVKPSAPKSLKRPSSPPPSSATAEAGPSTSKKLKSSSTNPQYEEYMAAMTSKRGKNAGRSWEDLPDAEPAKAGATMTPVEKGDVEGEDEQIFGDGGGDKEADVEMEEPSGEEEEKKGDEGEELDDEAWMRKMMSGGLEDETPAAAAPVEEKKDTAKKSAQPILEEEEKKREVEVVQADGVNSVEDQDPKDQILSTSRLFLRNLPFSCTPSDLTAVLTPFGPLSSAPHLPLSSTTHQPLGTAFVKYQNARDAVAAYEKLDGRAFMGRLLHVLPGRRELGAVEDGVKAGTGGAGGEGGGKAKTSLKKGKEDMKRGEAGKDFNWAMLYMNSDAVISSVADRMHLSKADILDSSSNSGASPAVKLALAETHVIQETKTFFLDQGIILDALIPPPSTSSSAPPPPQKRSQTTILVKNIPYGTTLATLEEMFGAHGELARVLMPPAGTLAIVEFVESHACRDAFRALAYKRMGNSVLYLEKGPEGMFDREKMGGGAGKPVVKGGVPIPQLSANATASTSTAATASTSQISPPNSTLFLKNLNFSTTTALLTTTFSHLPSFLFARVQTKPHPSKTNVQLSMGFGFVGFRDPESAKAAKETMDGFRLDGHVLEVKFAQRDPGEMEGVGGGKGEKGSVGKGTTCKMVVKNVPFEATKKDIRELFNAYGQVKSVRLPRKFDTKARGFAFLEFFSRRDAEAAMLALRHTHLLGRHLVLEWAEEETDIEKLREEAKDVVKAKNEGGMASGKKSKVVI